MPYRFTLICPRCNKTSETIAEQRISPRVNCGHCLMAAVEVVEFKVISVDAIQVEK